MLSILSRRRARRAPQQVSPGSRSYFQPKAELRTSSYQRDAFARAEDSGNTAGHQRGKRRRKKGSPAETCKLVFARRCERRCSANENRNRSYVSETKKAVPRITRLR